MSIRKKIAKQVLLLIWNTIQFWNNKRNLFTYIDRSVRYAIEHRHQMSKLQKMRNDAFYVNMNT